MIVKSLPAVMARPVSLLATPVSTLALAALLLAAPWTAVHAQASAPAAVPAAGVISPDPGQPRDFAAERKAIGDSRAWTNYRFAAAERECYSKFLVNRCIEQAKDA